MIEVRFEIGEVVLHGVGTHRPEDLRTVLGGALTKILTERGVPDAWYAGREPTTHPQWVTVDSGMPTSELADRLAVALYEGLGG